MRVSDRRLDAAPRGIPTGELGSPPLPAHGQDLTIGQGPPDLVPQVPASGDRRAGGDPSEGEHLGGGAGHAKRWVIEAEVVADHGYLVLEPSPLLVRISGSPPAGERAGRSEVAVVGWYRSASGIVETAALVPDGGGDLRGPRRALVGELRRSSKPGRRSPPAMSRDASATGLDVDPTRFATSCDRHRYREPHRYRALEVRPRSGQGARPQPTHHGPQAPGFEAPGEC